MRDSPGRLDGEICWENIVATITEIVSKFKRNILKNHSSRILPRKVFFCTKSVFPYFLTIFIPLCALFDPLKPSLQVHYLQIHCVGLFEHEFFYHSGSDPNPTPTIKLYINQSFRHYHKNIQNKITHCNIT